MLRLIEADVASTGKTHLRNRTPAFFLNCRALHALTREGRYLSLQIVAHEIEFVGATIAIGRVECGLCRREGEDQPAVTGIDRPKAEDIAEECPVRLGVFAVGNYVSARDHLPLP